MALSLGLAGLTLRAGLRLRRGRLAGRRPSPEALRAHLRLAKPSVALLVLGFAGGPISAVWLRGWDAFHSAHSWIALATLSLFVATAWLGRNLERGRSGSVDRHAALALLATGFGVAAFVSGFVLLP